MPFWLHSVTTAWSALSFRSLQGLPYLLFCCGGSLEWSEPIDHFRITAIWPGDRIPRPEHPTENEVRRRSCDESVWYFSGTNFALITKYSIHIYHFIFDLDTLWNESIYKIHLLLQIWNKIIADNEQKLGKLGESKFIHTTVNGGGL